MSIARLTEGSDVTRQAVTKHLRVMEDAGLVSCEWRGRETVWQLDRQGLDEAQRHIDLISRQWDGALDRLRKLVED